MSRGYDQVERCAWCNNLKRIYKMFKFDDINWLCHDVPRCRWWEKKNDGE